MRLILLLVFALVIAVAPKRTFGQNADSVFNRGQRYFDKAYGWYSGEKWNFFNKKRQHQFYKKAQREYKDLIKQYPDYQYYPHALFYISYIDHLMENRKKAKHGFENILKEDLSRFDTVRTGLGFSLIKTGIVCKGSAAGMLSSFAMDKKQFREALYYMRLRDEHPYGSFCGFGEKRASISSAIIYAKAYHGLGLWDSAILTLKHVIDGYKNFGNNSGAIGYYMGLLREKYSNEYLKMAADSAANKVVVEHDKYHEGAYTYFMGNKIWITRGLCETYFFDAPESEAEIKQKYTELFKQSPIYQLTR